MPHRSNSTFDSTKYVCPNWSLTTDQGGINCPENGGRWLHTARPDWSSKTMQTNAIRKQKSGRIASENETFHVVCRDCCECEHVVGSEKAASLLAREHAGWTNHNVDYGVIDK